MSPASPTAARPGPVLPPPASLGAVATGGAVGTALRATAITATAPAPAFPVTVLAINLLGALVLGVLVEALPHHRAQLRLLLGTGVVGGFTTYGAVALDTARLLDTAPLVALAYCTATVGVGGLATAAGLRLGRHLRTERER